MSNNLRHSHLVLNDTLCHFPTIIISQQSPTFSVGVPGCPKISDNRGRVRHCPKISMVPRSLWPKISKTSCAFHRKSDNFCHASLLFVTVQPSPSLNIILHHSPTNFANFPCSLTFSVMFRSCWTTPEISRPVSLFSEYLHYYSWN